MNDKQNLNVAASGPRGCKQSLLDSNSNVLSRNSLTNLKSILF